MGHRYRPRGKEVIQPITELSHPPKFSGFGGSDVPSLGPEFLRADRSVSRNDVPLASRLEVDRHSVRSGLRDDNVETIDHHAQIALGHAPRLPIKNGTLTKAKSFGP